MTTPLATLQHRLGLGQPSRLLLATASVVSLVYLSWWFQPGHVGNPYLYGALLFGEIYHVGMALVFWQTLWPGKRQAELKRRAPNLTVDVFITVAGEPIEVVRETVQAAKKINYNAKTISILNDGFVAKKDNWRDMETLAKDEDVLCITRTTPGGAKAGNINNALRRSKGSVVVIFDADMAPKRDFLLKVMPYFADPQMAFVQTPQYYHNRHTNAVTGGSWEQQEFFFGPIMRGKNSHNAAFICGTNVAIRRTSLLAAGGMCEDNIAEDFLTSLRIHQQGGHSHYLTDVLATGLAPEDMMSYYKQQLRWARGSLEVLFGSNPLFKRGLTVKQKLQYLSSALYYFNGAIVLIGLAMPLLYLFFNLQAVTTTSSSFALYFTPFMFLSLYTLFIASGGALTFRAMAFSQSSWVLQLQALFSVVFRRKMGFAVTPKQAQSGNFLNLAYPHMAYIALGVIGLVYAISQQGLTASVATNMAWFFFNATMFLPFIAASYRWGSLFSFGRDQSKALRVGVEGAGS